MYNPWLKKILSFTLAVIVFAQQLDFAYAMADQPRAETASVGLSVEAEIPETIGASGFIRYVGAGVFEPDAAALTLLANGRAVTDAVPLLTQEGDAWQYAFIGLPRFDSHGTPYTYTVSDSTHTAQSQTALFAVSGGELVAASRGVDLVYVEKRQLQGRYVVEKGPADPEPADSVLAAEAWDGDRTLPVSATATLRGSDTGWQLSVPAFHPLTEQPLNYRVWAEESDDRYHISYQNPAPHAAETRFAVDGGTIVNRYRAPQNSPSPLNIGVQSTVTATNDNPMEFYINWNDNDAADRPALTLQLYYQYGDMSAPAPLDAAVAALWGMDPVRLDTPAPNQSSYNIWIYTFTLPQTLDDGTDSFPITYTFSIANESDLSALYFVEDKGDSTIMNTRKTMPTFRKIWKDSDNQYATRPDADALKANLRLYRTAMDGVSKGEAALGTLSALSEGTAILSDTATGTWSIGVSGLPAFAPDGFPYHYHIKETNDTLAIDDGTTLSDSATVRYAAVYTNVGNNAEVTTACHDGGVITNTLVDRVDFTATKLWQDDNAPSTIADRPSGTLYLYRYPHLPGRDYTTATPVVGMEMPLDTTTQSYTIRFNDLPGFPAEGLPRFDNEGNEYVYFLQEILSGATAGNYTKFYAYTNEADNRDSDAKTVLFHNGTLQNRRTGTIDLPVTKSWKAAAKQNMTASVILKVEYKSKGEDDSQYTAVEAVTSDGLNPGEFLFDGFRAEVMSLTHIFAGLPQFDANGLAYEYRVTESVITIDGHAVDVTNPANYTMVGANKRCVIDGYTFELSQETDADGAITLTNRLVGQTEVWVKKVWNKTKGETTMPTITFNLYRNGTLLSHADTTEAFEGTEVSGYAIPHEHAWIQNMPGYDKTGHWLVVSGLDRYDSEGREYRYSVTENDVTDYTHTITTNRHEATGGGVRTGRVDVTIANTPAGTGRHIDVSKEWLDDGDENCRGPVTVELFHSATGAAPWTSTGTTAILSASNDWTVRLPLLAGDQDYTHYFVREVSVKRGETEYFVALAGGVDDSALTTTPKLLGELITNAHQYNVYAYTNSIGSQYRFRNVRKGTVNIDLAKEWVDHSYHEDYVNQAITLEIRQRLNYTEPGTETVYGAPIVLDGTKDIVEFDFWKARVENLPKYNENGVLYLYTVAETSVEETGGVGATPGSTHTVTDGSYTLANSHRYSVDIAVDPVYGEHNGKNNPQPDEFAYTVTNARSDAVDFKVYKVWKDITRNIPGTFDASRETRTRPDIYLTLYQTINGVTQVVTPYVERVWTTVGTFNEYYWQCRFDPLPRYTADGTEIIYSVEEKMPFPGEYQAAYYAESPVPDTTPALSAVTTVPIYSMPADATALWRSTDAGWANPGKVYVPNGGTIVNTRSADRYLTGQKIWLNMPTDLAAEDFPSVTLQLKIYKYDDLQHQYQFVDDGLAHFQLVTLNSGARNFVFGNGTDTLDKYDDYGTLIKYRAEEVGGLTPGYMSPVYDDYTLTVTNAYNVNAPFDSVSVKVDKVWDVTPPITDPALYPTAKVELWRVMTDSGGLDRGTPKKISDVSFPYGGATTHTFTDLYQYGANGYPYRYYVKETLPGYQVAISADKDATKDFAFTVTNTYTGKDGDSFIKLGGVKQWADNSGLYGTRPTGVTLKVYRAVTGVTGSTIEITDSVDIVWNTSSVNSWTYTVNAKAGARNTDVGNADGTGTGAGSNGETLYRYAPNGSAYLYYVEEVKPNDNYTMSKVTGEVASGIGGADNLTLKASISGKTATASFKNTLVGSDYTLSKVWMKDTDDSGSPVALAASELAMMLPDSITFKVQYDTGSGWADYLDTNHALVTKTVNKAAILTALNGSHTMTVAFDMLPKYDSLGTAMVYRAVETAVNGHALVSDAAGGYTMSAVYAATDTVTNTLTTLPLTIRKQWDDSDNQDGVRPTSITFSIVRDGVTASPITVTLTTSDWTAGKTVHVPMYKADGVTPSTYTVQEQLSAADKANYTLQGETGSGSYTLADPDGGGTGEKVYTFINEHVGNLMDVSVAKAWNHSTITTVLGAAAVSDIQPTAVTVTLKRKSDDGTSWITVPAGELVYDNSGTPTQQSAVVELNASNNWSHTWHGLQARWNETGGSNTSMKRHQYQVVETVPNGYTAAYKDTSSAQNTFQSEPVAVTDLQCNAQSVAGIALANNLKTTTLPVEKLWDTKDSQFTQRLPVVVRLVYRKAGDTAWTDALPEATLDATDSNSANHWKSVFTGLPAEDSTGTAYEYSVRELSIGGVALTGGEAYSFASQPGYAGSGTLGHVTNTLITRTDITVKKLWDDKNNQDAVRPATVTVTLWKDRGTPYEDSSQSVTLQPSNQWSHTWDALPRYRPDGALCTYQVEEITAATGYTVAYSEDANTSTSPVITETSGSLDTAGRTVSIRNTYSPRVMDLAATKRWDDQSNLYGTRPGTVRLQLMATTNPDGVTGAAAVSQSGLTNPAVLAEPNPASDTWDCLWTNLPVMQAGKPVYYSVVELDASGAISAAPVPGYTAPTATYTAAGNGTVLTGTAVAGSLADADNTRHAVVIRNPLDTVDITAKKQWTDYGNLYGSRPDSLLLALQRKVQGSSGDYAAVYDSSGAAVTITMPAEASLSEQSVAFDDMPRTDTAGTPYLYRVVEVSVNSGGTDIPLTLTTPADATAGTFSIGTFEYEYAASTAAVSGGFESVITNILQEESITLSGQKTWQDSDNRYQVRPDNLVLTAFYRDQPGDPWVEIPSAHYDIQWTKGANQWTYRIAYLPRYVPGTTTHREYSVMETVPPYYLQTLPAIGSSNPDGRGSGTQNPTTGEITGIRFTNTLDTGAVLSVTKQKDRGPDAMEFSFRVTLSDSPLTAVNPGILYTGAYDVYDGDADLSTATPISANTADGVITIRADQKFVLTDLPYSFYYQVEELEHADYLLQADLSSQLTGRLGLVPTETLAVNHAKTELAIDNNTVNPGVENDGSLTDAGGKVVVVVNDKDTPDQGSNDDYKLDQLAVAWQPDTYWLYGDSFTIYFTEFGSTDEQVLVISNYLNLDGTLKRFANCKYSNAALFRRFVDSGAYFEWTESGAIKLVLAEDVDDMPRQTRIEVEFLPTLAVDNVTADNAGGTVMVEGGTPHTDADGVPEYAGTPYRALSVTGTAMNGYFVSTKRMAVRNLNDLKGQSVLLDIGEDGTFSTLLPTVINGNPVTVAVTGRASYGKDANGNVTEVVILLDQLPVPLQIDLAFEPIPVKQPEEPTEPTEPTDPTEPTTPTEPTAPTEPTDGNDPGNGNDSHGGRGSGDEGSSGSSAPDAFTGTAGSASGTDSAGQSGGTVGLASDPPSGTTPQTGGHAPVVPIALFALLATGSTSLP
ncbi:Cna B-type domain-containing protein, partial [Ruminococcaceae bacterium OttesenSCG-928-L11]|nr:Cna B-type domain-containing protein [Ruminococcaceae bacterium OttesenSCG-928-L11]